MTVDADDRVSRGTLGLPTDYRPPSPGLETLIAEAFSEVFKIEGVGADDEFYDLGGDSLLGETLSMEILQRTGKDFQVSWFYDNGTPAKVAKRLAAESKQDAGPPPIFMVHGKGGYASPRPEFRDGLPPGQRVEMFELPGLRGNGRTYDSVEEIARVYVGQLLAAHPEGPVVLGSFCSGALIALEMVRQLEAVGRPVHHLVLVDPGAPLNLFDRHRREMATRGIEASRSEERRRRQSKLKLLLWNGLTLLALGRISDGSRERDFQDARLRRLNARFQTWLIRVRNRLPGTVRQVGDGFSPVAQGKLLAAFQYYWPKPFEGAAVVLCAEVHLKHWQDGEFWGALLPNREVRIAGATHGDAVGNSTALAAELRRILSELPTSGRALESARWN